MRPAWRPMRAGDLPGVTALADRLHPHHPEAPEVFTERLALCPEGCRVLEGRTGLLGYALSHPWTGAGPPALDSRLGALPPRPGAWHIHDIALDASARGAGLGAAVLEALLAGKMLPATLVAIPGSPPYWARRGFRSAPVADGTALASYGAGATFMARPACLSGAAAV